MKGKGSKNKKKTSLLETEITATEIKKRIDQKEMC